MPQTSIDIFFKARKRPAENLLSSKELTRKLFAEDAGPSSLVSSPTRRVAIVELEEDIPKVSSNSFEEILPLSSTGPSQNTKPINTTEDPTPTTPTRSPSTQIQLQKDLALGEFKKVVRQSKRYQTLKEKLSKVNASTARLKAIDEALNKLNGSPDLKNLKPVEFEINASPTKCGNLKPRRLFGHGNTRSPRKDLSYISPRKLLDEGPSTSPLKPAHERYQCLLLEGKDALPLPPKYSVLKEVFNSVETLVRMLISRGEIVTFKRIRGDVQKMTRRNFTEEHLGLIKAVYPEAFNLKYEKVKVPFSREECLDLVIEKPNIKEKSIAETKKIFEEFLLQRTKLHHQEFLKTLNPPLNVNIEEIRRWHPRFDLYNVPDLDPVQIPKQEKSTNAVVSAKDVLERTHDMIACNKRMERAVTILVDDRIKKQEENENTKTKSRMIPASPISSPIAALEKALKGVPKSLLEKIRSKRAAKIVQTITQTPEQAKEVAMLSRLPELAKIMRIVFVSEKKGILPEELVISKVAHSFKEKMHQSDLVAHLKLISKYIPGWLNFCTVRNVSYIRLSKDADMSRVLGRLQKLAQQT